ncbi:hypothetical protein C5L34_001057 [Lentilactobacillus hilgardii]|nr:hypothetical protein C5L34_001057 [Lentilactobacillus hilgardii]
MASQNATIQQTLAIKKINIVYLTAKICNESAVIRTPKISIRPDILILLIDDLLRFFQTHNK